MPQTHLDSFVADQLPALKSAADPRAHAITFRDLLWHSGGWDSAASFPPFFLSSEERQAKLGLVDVETEDCRPVAETMARLPLQAAPGTSYAYSNLGYCWLGIWLETVTGQLYATAVHELVPEARGLSLDAADVTVRHHGLKEQAELLAVQPKVIAAAGGWIASADAYGAFATVPIDDAVLERAQFAPEGPSHYGLGWRVWPRDGGPLLTHYGAVPGVFSIVVRTLDGRSVTALFNGRPAQEVAAFYEFYQLVSGLRHLEP
jgi:N-acyl-D-amino-acid deacylase